MKNYYDSVAIIGIGCRFPGANDYNQFWTNLEEGTDSVTEIPSQRWDIDKFYSPKSEESNKSISKWGGFIEDVDKFDARFFGISPREATRMDPQQRLMLELTWSCIEDAGYSPSKLSGSNIGVFVGVCNFDYKELQNRYEVIEGHNSTGTYTCIIPNRISYFFNFHGPSVPVDTACSSSLVAIHQAINALKENECEMALVGGINVLCTPTSYISFSKLGMLSPSGKCKTFDAKADGYVRGEGAGIILLKPLKKAVEDKNHIYGLVKGSAINHGGRARTLTSPNAYSQSQVVRSAYTKANIPPNTISYIEAHGTGTPLGDPIEINGLKRAFAQLHQQYGIEATAKNYCGLGSVKANIGHLESAAGIAGVIKVLLAMKHQKLPRIINYQELNPRIKLESSPFYIVEKNQDWQPIKTPAGEPLPRRASVSSFGFGGANAHVVLEEAPASYPTENEIKRPRHILTLSAKNEQGLRELAQAYQVFLQSQQEANLANVCFTANTGRTHFDYRLCLSAESIVELCQKLRSLLAGEETTGVVEGKVIDESPKIAFLFTGQGSQYVGMGYQLYQTQPTFRRALQQCEEILRPYLDKPLLKVLYPDSGEVSPLDETAYTQPALFALEYALAQLWFSWGIKPQTVMGHSVGEYVAACVAGVFSLEDGLKLIAHRGRLMQALPRNGVMVSVLADETRVKTVIKSYGEKVSIAAFNGPESVVISGEQQAMEEIVAQLCADCIKTKQLQVSHAFHSSLMSPILEEFEQIARQITYNKPQINIISNLTGEIATEEIGAPEYWCRHIRQPVRFAGGMESIAKEGYEVFVECGAKPILSGMGRQCLPEALGLWLPSLRLGQEDWQQMLESLAKLYVRGVAVDWCNFDRDYERYKVALPTYAFQRQRYWSEHAQNGTQQYASLPEKSQSQVFKTLNQDDIKEGIRKLEKVGKFSQEEMKLLPKMLEVLFEQNQQLITSSFISDWFYELQWQPQVRFSQEIVFQQAVIAAQAPQLQPEEPGSNSRNWLILADKGGIGWQLATKLQTQGDGYTLVYAGQKYQQIGEKTFQIDPTSLKDFQRLWATVSSGNSNLEKIVYLWSLDSTPTAQTTVNSLQTDQSLICGSILHLLKVLYQAELTSFPHLWLVTRGTQRIQQEKQPLSVAQAPLWGLGRVVSLEHPEIWGGLIDLDPSNTETAATELIEELWDVDKQEQVAFRDGQRYVARLVSKEADTTMTKALSLKADGTYLIAGSLVGFGLQLSKWMVERGARHLVLITQSQVSSECQKQLGKLEQLGTEVMVIQADISQEREIAQVLADISSNLPPLQGIIHLEEILDDGTLKRQDWQCFAQVMAPKVAGAWNLHCQTQNLSLDFFVLFSSVVSLLGSPTQGNYAAANAFLDALSQYRCSLGLPVLSINWGPCAETPMTAAWSSLGQQRWTEAGVEVTEPQQGLQVIEQLLQQVSPQITVFPVDWPQFFAQFLPGDEPALLREIARKHTSLQKNEQSSVPEKPQLLEKLQASPPNQYKSVLIAHLQKEIAKVLGRDSSQLPKPQLGFFDMGMDSLMSIELKNRLETSLGKSLTSTLTFEYSNIEAIAEYLLKEVLSLESATICDSKSEQHIQEQAEILADIEQLSAEELEALIDAELQNLTS